MPYLLLHAGGPVLGRELCRRAYSRSGRGPDPDDRSEMGVDRDTAGIALSAANPRQSPAVPPNAPTLLILTLCGQVRFSLNSLYWPAVDFGAERSDLHVCDPLHGAYY